MAAKLALVFVAAFVLFQVRILYFYMDFFLIFATVFHYLQIHELFQVFSLQTDATIIRRDAPATPQKNDLEEALNSMKQGFEEFVSKVQVRQLLHYILAF